jgi:hypothetical protein
MSEVFRIPSDRQPWDREGKVFISRPWFLFLQGLFTRAGGATGGSVEEDEVSPLSGDSSMAAVLMQSIQDMQCDPVQQLEMQVQHLESQLSSQRDEIAELRRYVEGLAAGTII